MKFILQIRPISILSILLFSSLTIFDAVYALEKPVSELSNDSLLVIAREIMHDAGYCALITVDSTGQPQARVMDAFLPEDDMVVWLATNPRSRKVRNIQRNPRVTLFYFDQEGLGTVSLICKAKLVNDAEEKARRWKEEWEPFYPSRQTDYILIMVITEKVEIVSIKHSITGNEKTWAAPTVFINQNKSEK